MDTNKMNEPITFSSLLPWLIKGFGAVVGGVIALILGGYINPDGSFRITRGLVLNLSLSISISIYGGSALIEFWALHNKDVMTHGFIMLMVGVVGMVSISVLYQSIALLRGKLPSEIAGEIAASYRAVITAFKGKQ